MIPDALHARPRPLFSPISIAANLPLILVLVGLGLPGHSAAQTSEPASATNTAPKPPPSALDNDEMVQLQKARTQVLSANPDLKAEEERLKTMHDAAQKQPPATADQKNAMFAEWKAYQKKMRADMLQLDPTLGPIFAKLDNARKHGAPTPFQPAAK
jgi:hypothetical protein